MIKKIKEGNHVYFKPFSENEYVPISYTSQSQSQLQRQDLDHGGAGHRGKYPEPPSEGSGLIPPAPTLFWSTWLNPEVEVKGKVKIKVKIKFTVKTERQGF